MPAPNVAHSEAICQRTVQRFAGGGASQILDGALLRDSFRRAQTFLTHDLDLTPQARRAIKSKIMITSKKRWRITETVVD